jgi:hypothetical protein
MKMMFGCSAACAKFAEARTRHNAVMSGIRRQAADRLWERACDEK